MPEQNAVEFSEIAAIRFKCSTCERERKFLIKDLLDERLNLTTLLLDLCPEHRDMKMAMTKNAELKRLAGFFPFFAEMVLSLKVGVGVPLSIYLDQR